jgi:drug/metabolite transporter (DMT)-like permease
MPFSSWQRYLYRVVAGSVLLIWGIVEILLSPSGDSILPTALLAAGLAFLVTGVSRRRKYGEGPEQDERSRRIGAWGMSYSWYLSLTIMWFLFLLDHLGFVTLAAGTALGVSLIAMTLSAVAFQMYLFRKGDVE